MQAQTAGFLHTHAMDTVSLTFGAGNKTPEALKKTSGELKEALELGPFASEEEFQEERTRHLATMFGFDPRPYIEGKIPITKAVLTAILKISSNSSEAEILETLKSKIQHKNPTKEIKKEDMDLVYAVILAYPTPHPFDYRGQTLGGDDPAIGNS